ncbi:MAG: hypothetical protein NTY38_28320, partial [Acidobacteria bacterium]|nr:hypothetical protein [Acidobacteriota bacterium]
MKQVIARALESMAPTADRALPPPTSSPEDVRARVEAYLTRLGESHRVPRMRQVFGAYAGGASLEQVIASTGCSRGTVSNYLNELERETGASIVRGHRRAVKTDGLQEERENGQRRASLHDFHSFRVTWITLALAAGVPLELVQRVTGHRTVAVVLKHYFRPGREDFRQALVKAMPTILAHNHRTSAKDEVRAILMQMTAETFQSDR